MKNGMRVLRTHLVLIGIGLLLVLSLIDIDASKYDTASRLWLSVAIGIACLPLLILGGLRALSQSGRFALWIGLFVAAFFIAFAFSFTKNYGFSEVIVTATIAFVACVIAQFDEQKMRMLRLLIVWGAVSSSLFGFWYFTAHPETRLAGFFLGAHNYRDFFPNAFATFLLMSWPLLLNKVTIKNRWLASLCAVFLLTALSLTFSRGAWLVALLQIALISYMYRTKLRRYLLPVGSVFVAAVALIFVLTHIRAQHFPTISLGEKITFQNNEKRTSGQERLDFWTGSISLGLQGPITGYGPMSFRYAYPSVQKGVIALSDHPHNWLLKILVEEGSIALLFFVLALGFFFMPHRALSYLSSTATLPLYIALVGGMLHSMGDFNMNFTANLLVFFILAGMLLSHARPAPLSKNTTSLTLILWIFIAIITTGLSIAQLKVMIIEREQKNFMSRDTLRNKAEEEIRQDHLSKAYDLLDIHLQKNSLDARAWYLRGEYAQALSLDPLNNFSYYRGYLEKNPPPPSDFQERLLGLLSEYDSLLLGNVHYTAFTENASQAPAVYDLLNLPDDAKKMREHAARVRADFLKKSPPRSLTTPRTLMEFIDLWFERRP